MINIVIDFIKIFKHLNKTTHAFASFTLEIADRSDRRITNEGPIQDRLQYES